MSIKRHIAAVLSGAVLLSGCAASRIPAATTSVAPELRNAPWPGFLPVDMILANNPVSTSGILPENRSLQARAIRLRQRARLLEGPLITAKERRKMEQAIKHPQS